MGLLRLNPDLKVSTTRSSRRLGKDEDNACWLEPRTEGSRQLRDLLEVDCLPGGPTISEVPLARSHRRLSAGIAAFLILIAAAVRLLSVGGSQATDRFSSNAAALRDEFSALELELESLEPKGPYILIDTAENRLYLKQGEKILLDAVCSTGSGRRLRAAGRSWSFDTPKGHFRILSKEDDPIWVKPDWAFLEEGKPVPTREEDRVEKGVLGEHALGFGDGYFIHGTLYTRLLGQNVTHGCIRLGREDLDYLNQTVPLNAEVYIY